MFASLTDRLYQTQLQVTGWWESLPFEERWSALNAAFFALIIIYLLARLSSTRRLHTALVFELAKHFPERQPQASADTGTIHAVSQAIKSARENDLSHMRTLQTETTRVLTNNVDQMSELFGNMAEKIAITSANCSERLIKMSQETLAAIREMNAQNHATIREVVSKWEPTTDDDQ